MERLDAVQGLRAIAAWMVVIAHGAIWVSDFGSPGLPDRSFAMLGSLGVLMFFTISGFIMVFISGGDFGRPGAAGTFLRRRVIRVVPLYWLMTALAAVIVLRKGEGLPASHLIQSLLFIPHSTGGPLMRPVLGVGWTLNYEMFFYALFAAALMFRRGLPILCGVIAALLVVGQFINPIWEGKAFGLWTDPPLLLFLLGIALALLRQGRPDLRVRRPFLLIGAGVVCVLLVQEAVLPPGGRSTAWQIAVMAAGGLLAAFAILSPGHARVPRWLVFGGDASFSLYLAHPLLFGVITRMGGEAIARASPVAGICWFVAISTVAGFALYLFVERPMTRWLLRRGRPVPTGSVAAPA